MITNVTVTGLLARRSGPQLTDHWCLTSMRACTLHCRMTTLRSWRDAHRNWARWSHSAVHPTADITPDIIIFLTRQLTQAQEKISWPRLFTIRTFSTRPMRWRWSTAVENIIILSQLLCVLFRNWITDFKTHSIFTKHSPFAQNFCRITEIEKGVANRFMSCPAWNINNKYFPTWMAVKYFRWNIFN